MVHLGGYINYSGKEDVNGEPSNERAKLTEKH